MTSTVFFSKTLEKEEFARLLLEKYKEFLSGNVLVKPNIVSHEEYPTTTDLSLFRAVLEYLLTQSCSVQVVEGPAVDVPLFSVKKSSFQAICDEIGIPLISIYDKKMKRVQTPRNFKFKMSTTPFQDVTTIISLPVLKIHPWCFMTGALKNSFGFLSKGERIKVHTPLKSLDKVIAEVNWTLYRDLGIKNITIVDGIKTMLKANERRHGGKITDLGILYGGIDPVALDHVGFKFLKDLSKALQKKADATDIKYIKLAQEYGVGSTSYELKEIQ
ncbi:MAG: DUF362 domain-containing protein [Candidatus Helarchaeota archaeon]